MTSRIEISVPETGPPLGFTVDRAIETRRSKEVVIAGVARSYSERDVTGVHDYPSREGETGGSENTG